MPTLTPTTLRRVRALVEDVTQLDSVSPDAFPYMRVSNEARALLPLLRPRKAPAKRLGTTRKQAKEAKRQRHREETASIREAVFKRAEGRCEYRNPETGVPCFSPGTVLDHWEGGVGRRRQRQSVESCWMLCDDHNALRTANWPDAEHWNGARDRHCRQWFIRFVPHITRASRRTTTAKGAGR